MSTPAIGLLASDVPFPPSVEDFYPPAFIEGAYPWATKSTLLVWVGVGAVIIFFLLAYRNPKIVPTRAQWMAETIYGFGRGNMSTDMIGHEGIKFAPYFTTLFCFILVTNLWGILPFFQISPNAHIAFPILLTVISYVMFNYVGIRRFGFVAYMKKSAIPPAPWFILPLLVPIEFFSTFIVRPITLSLRLFANMFAGHMILLVFMLSGFALLQANWLFAPLSLVSWALAIALTFLEAVVVVLQAYVFVILTSSYVQGALAEEH